MDGYPARLVVAEPRPGRRTYQLAFGNSAFAVIVTTQYPAADTAAGSALRRVLLTARYDADSFARVGFRLDDRASGVRFVRTVGNWCLYARVVTVILMPFTVQ